MINKLYIMGYSEKPKPDPRQQVGEPAIWTSEDEVLKAAQAIVFEGRRAIGIYQLIAVVEPNLEECVKVTRP